MRNISLSIFLIGLLFFTKAQIIETDYGVVTKEMFAIDNFPAQPDSRAIILSNFGQFYGANDNGSEKMIREHHLKIKILNEEGVKEYANLKVNYFPSNGRQFVTQISASSYNLDDEGEIIKQTVGKQDAFVEKVNEYRSQKILAVPNVKVGSIVELKYIISTSISYASRPFLMQLEDPVLKCEFRMQNPVATSFTCIRTGLEAENIIISKSKSIRNPIFGSIDGEVNTFEIDSLIGIRYEPYVNSIQDYLTKIRFQLYAIDNGQYVESFAQDWKELSKLILVEINEQMNVFANNFIYKEQASIYNGKTTDLEKIEATFAYLRSDFIWNGKTEVDYKESRIKETYNNKKGSSSQLNLLMAYLLSKEGVPISPALVSTHENGRVMLEYPYRYQFNNLVWYYKGEKNNYILDVRNSNRHFSVIPKDLLSTYAVLLDKENPKLLKISSSFKWNETRHIVIEDFNEEKINGTIKIEYKGYAALDKREHEFLSNFVEVENKELKSLTINEDSVIGFKDLGSKIERRFNFETTDYIIYDEGEILINPMLCFSLAENPFKSNTRNLPIDFNYPLTLENRITIKIPEGYELVEMPENRNVRLADNGISYLIQSVQIGSSIQLISSLKTSRSSFEADEYTDVKDIYDLALKNQNIYLIFKKI